jgi:hypothetical protein
MKNERIVDEWLDGMSKRGGVKFQQHNSSQKIDGSNEGGKGLSYTQKVKERGSRWLPCVGNPREEKLLERGRPN